MFCDFEQWNRVRHFRRYGVAYSPATENSIRARLASVARFAHVESSRQLAELLADRGAVCALLDRMYENQAPGTIRGTLATLRCLGEFALEREWISSVALQPRDAPRRVPARSIVLYRRNELDALLRCAQRRTQDFRYWMFLATMIDTGRRVHEILDLRFEDVRLDAEPPHFRITAAKVARCQFVPLTRFLREEVWTETNIKRLKWDGDPRIRPRMRQMPFPWSYCTVRDRLQRTSRKAGVPYRNYHAFRHTKATGMLERGVPLAAVSSLLGHASIATTDRTYNHANALTFAAFVDG
jgi:integrase